MSLRYAAGLGMILLATFAPPSVPQTPLAKAFAWSPDAIAWQETEPSGAKYALLEGVRDTSGVGFTYAFFIPAGVWDGAHSHSQTVRVFVARGTLYLGYGDQFDRAAARTYPAGSVLLVPAGAVHFDGADEDTLIFGAVATGPWSTSYMAPNKP